MHYVEFYYTRGNPAKLHSWHGADIFVPRAGDFVLLPGLGCKTVAQVTITRSKAIVLVHP